MLFGAAGWVPPSVPMPLAEFDADQRRAGYQGGNVSESPSEEEDEEDSDEAKPAVKEEDKPSTGADGGGEAANPLATLIGAYSDGSDSGDSSSSEEEPADVPPGTSFF